MKINRDDLETNIFYSTNPLYWIYLLILIIGWVGRNIYRYLAIEEIWFYWFRMNKYDWTEKYFNHTKYFFKNTQSIFKKITLLKIYKQKRREQKLKIIQK